MQQSDEYINKYYNKEKNIVSQLYNNSLLVMVRNNKNITTEKFNKMDDNRIR